MNDTQQPQEDGFEYKAPGEEEATFYRWSVSDGAKDLMLIDRFTGMPVTEFFALVEDNFDRGRAPILLALIATSVRARHPEWTVERVARLVSDLSLSDVTFVDADNDEEDESSPPAEAGDEPAPTENASASPPEESRPSAIRQVS